MYLHAKVSCIERVLFLINVAGMEAVGIVTAVGSGPTGIQVGDLVGYAGQPMGSYAEEQILPANKVVPIPSSIDPAVAASIMLKGMTAQFLLRSCFKVGYYYKLTLLSYLNEAFLLLTLL
jgi:NADPH:quinone reductase-like Zn-dependent oxidoreductase